MVNYHSQASQLVIDPNTLPAFTRPEISHFTFWTLSWNLLHSHVAFFEGEILIVRHSKVQAVTPWHAPLKSYSIPINLNWMEFQRIQWIIHSVSNSNRFNCVQASNLIQSHAIQSETRRGCPIPFKAMSSNPKQFHPTSFSKKQTILLWKDLKNKSHMDFHLPLAS